MVSGGLDADVLIRRTGFTLQMTMTVAPGEVVGLLGPNGAGKTTLLRAVAGLQPLDRGRITLGGRVLSAPATGVDLPPHRRRIGVVFQDYLLFPHLSVLDNVAFGLRSGGCSTVLARRVAEEWLRRVDLADLGLRRPASISGGQAQRVALARALAIEPELLLLDEPLAALDARTRLQVRSELRRHLSAFPGGVLLVTHDPVDAVVLADRLVVVEHGRLVQTGSPREVSRRPRTDYVARLVGLNLLHGRAEGQQVRLPGGGVVHTAEPADGAVSVAFRPAAVALFTRRPEGSPRNNWRGRVGGLELHGHGVRVQVSDAPDPGAVVLAEITQEALAALDLRPGDAVWASVKASDIEVYPS
jgi:molybdate transport system ATP-binding protein